jgi:hypothetical protein
MRRMGTFMPDALHPVLTATASIGAAPPDRSAFFYCSSNLETAPPKGHGWYSLILCGFAGYY